MTLSLVDHSRPKSNLFYFHAVFGKKIGEIIIIPPPFGLACPVWEIRDPPLIVLDCENLIFKNILVLNRHGKG